MKNRETVHFLAGNVCRTYPAKIISLHYSPTGIFTGTPKVRQTAAIRAGGKEFTSNGSVEILDAIGITVE